MCFISAPKPSPPLPQPTKTESVDQGDAVSSQIQQEKRRKGFQSTIATGGTGVTGTAPIKRTQLGQGG